MISKMLMWFKNLLEFGHFTCGACDRAIKFKSGKHRYAVPFPYGRVVVDACIQCIDHHAVPESVLGNGSKLFEMLLANNRAEVYASGKLNVKMLFESFPDLMIYTVWSNGVYESAIECLQEHVGVVLAEYLDTDDGLQKIESLKDFDLIESTEVRFLTASLYFDANNHRLVGVTRQPHPLASGNNKIKMRLEDISPEGYQDLAKNSHIIMPKVDQERLSIRALKGHSNT